MIYQVQYTNGVFYTDIRVQNFQRDRLGNTHQKNARMDTKFPILTTRFGKRCHNIVYS